MPAFPVDGKASADALPSPYVRHALLAGGDESAMNFEGLGGFLRYYLYFPQLLARRE